MGGGVFDLSGEIKKLGCAVVDIDESAKIILNDDLFLGYNIPNGSHAETYLTMHKNSKLVVNGRFRAFRNVTVTVYEGAELTLGDSFINIDGIISCADKITIGDKCAIARNVYFYDCDQHSIITDGKEKVNHAPITLEDHVWIGAGCIILKGVTIGEGSVIGAGSVVTKNVPKNCLAAGNPARVIRRNVKWK
jgi:acetyltransferase-like isoleucine patch superfamily enzyme